MMKVAQFLLTRVLMVRWVKGLHLYNCLLTVSVLPVRMEVDEVAEEVEAIGGPSVVRVSH